MRYPRVGHAMQQAAGKILSLEQIAARLETVRRGGGKVAHCHGCFDLLHIGHIIQRGSRCRLRSARQAPSGFRATR